LSNKNGEENHRNWVHRLYLDAYFEDALAKMRADTGQGDTYALLTALNEYLYQHGYMNEKPYQMHKQKYSTSLIEEFENKQIVRPQKEEKRSEKELTLEQGMINILKQWDSAPEKSKLYYITQARAYNQWPLSQQILKKCETDLLAQTDTSEVDRIRRSTSRS